MQEWDSDVFVAPTKTRSPAQDADSVTLRRYKTTTLTPSKARVPKVHYGIILGSQVMRAMGWVVGDKVSFRFNRVRRELCVYRLPPGVGRNSTSIPAYNLRATSGKTRDGQAVTAAAGNITPEWFAPDIRAILDAVTAQPRSVEWRKSEDGLILSLGPQDTAQP